MTARASNKDHSLWGRNNVLSFGSFALSFGLLIGAPMIVCYAWNAIHKFHGGLFETLWMLLSSNPLNLLPKPTPKAFCIFGGWLLFQAVLFIRLPGKTVVGLPTPAGNRITYCVNGLSAWILSMGLYVGLTCVFKLFPASVISDNWEGLLVAANVYGFLLTAFVYAKAHIAPSHAADRKFSGSSIYDVFMGVELNPQLTPKFDLKLFHNGRPGIVAWSLINFSFAAAQAKHFGGISNAMFLVNYFQFLYVFDFFVNEEWYTRTIDIAHDHFGFYLAWGDSVWLPFMYTLQAQYLSKVPVSLPTWLFISVAVAGTMSYALFRAVNHQKDYIRKHNGQCIVWGKKATYIDARYVTACDGKTHKSLLITCGFWGICRHFNYLADICLSLCMCLCCGTQHILPYFYFFYMTVLLIHRAHRDDLRCQGKYGDYWTQYKQQVKYIIFPFIY